MCRGLSGPVIWPDLIEHTLFTLFNFQHWCSNICREDPPVVQRRRCAMRSRSRSRVSRCACRRVQSSAPRRSTTKPSPASRTAWQATRATAPRHAPSCNPLPSAPRHALRPRSVTFMCCPPLCCTSDACAAASFLTPNAEASGHGLHACTSPPRMPSTSASSHRALHLLPRAIFRSSHVTSPVSHADLIARHHTACVRTRRGTVRPSALQQC